MGRVHKRGTFSQRIGAVGCLALLTVAIALFYFITKGFSKDIEFAATERQGNQYQRPLEKLLEAFLQHGAVARQVRTGDRDLHSELTQVEQNIEAGLAELRKVDSELGETLQFTSEGLAKRKRDHYRWQNVADEWAALKSKAGSLSVEELDKTHAHLTEDIRTMITHLGDTSNLILDPDLDSYYLMDVTLLALPQTQDRLASIERMGQDLLRGGQVSETGRTQFAVAAALLKQADMDRVAADVQTAVNEDPSFNGFSPSLQKNLPVATASYLQANQVLLGQMQKIAGDPASQVDPREFGAAVVKARAASYALWLVSARELDGLLDKRIDDLSSLRFQALLWTAFALVLSVGIAVWVTAATIRDVGRAAREVLESSSQIAVASEQIAESSQQLADRASREADCLRESAEATREISQEAHRITEKSLAAANLGSQSRAKYAQTNESLEQMVASITAIEAESAKVTEIIRVIDGIAFQTNILALNAAVEAARAGEAGAGFAVVAAEVRSLAMRSAAAAKQTETLIEGSVIRSREGRAKVDEVAVHLRAVTETSVSIQKLLDEVSAGSHHQTLRIQQVAQAVAELESLTQENAASAEESAGFVIELHSQSSSLQGLAGQVTAMLGGKS